MGRLSVWAVRVLAAWKYFMFAGTAFLLLSLYSVSQSRAPEAGQNLR